MKRKKLTLTVDSGILERFREYYKGSLSSFLDGVMLMTAFGVSTEGNKDSDSILEEWLGVHIQRVPEDR